MKKSILYTLSLLVFATTFFACEEQNTPDPVRTQYPNIQSPILRDDAYYARLRAYKTTPHELAFGWYGSWTAIGSSEQTRLQSAPDSMDIISIWSTWHSLSGEQMADKAFVQQKLGTKVVFCISAKDVPAEFKVGGTSDGEITEESVIAYAKAWGKDSMDKYQYDGMDIDFETAIDHMGPLNRNPALFKKFCDELSKYIGPKSGTGRLFIIDGNFDASLFPDGVAELCNYAVGQAYNTTTSTALDGRVTRAAGKGWKNEQMIFTENFESLWQSGGPNYTCSDGVVRPSLLGMADYARTTPAVGFGSYHMEYEYGHSDMPYKYIRRAIQLANPAPIGDYTKNLVTLNETGEQAFQLLKLPSGVLIGDNVTSTFTIKTSNIVAADTDLKLMVDNSLIAAYNEYYFTDYKALDSKFISFSAPLHIAAGTQISTTPVTVTVPDFANIEPGVYVLPICVDVSSVNGFAANTAKQIKYLIISFQHTPIIASIPGSDKPQTVSLYSLPDNTVSGDIAVNISATLSLGASEDISATAVVDPSLVEAYNAEHGTTYTAIKAEDVTLSNAMAFPKGQTKSSNCTLTMPDLSKITTDNSLIAVRLTLPEEKIDYKVSTTLSVLYIIVKKIPGGNIQPLLSSSYATDWTYIANQDNAQGWVLEVTGNTDASDLKNFVADTQTKIYNDDYKGWYTDYVSSASYWPTGIQITLDMKAAQNIKAMLWNSYASNEAKTITAVQTSMDKVEWTTQNKMELSYTRENKQAVTFIDPVNTRYIRLQVKAGYGGTRWGFGMNKIEIWTPKVN